VPELGPDDRVAIAEHHEAVEHLLVPVLARYEWGELASTPEGRALLDSPPRLRRSLAIVALAGPRSGWTAAHLAEVDPADQWPADLVRALVRRRIEWDPESAALGLRLVAASGFDDERIQLVIKAAEQVAEAHPAHPGVVDGLERLLAMCRGTPTHRYRVPEMTARVVAALARHTPPELVDLSPVLDSDAWGPAARELLWTAADRGVHVTALLRCLAAAPRGSEPTAKWLGQVDTVLDDPETSRVVADLVQLLVDLPLTEDGRLIDAGNDHLARAAMWALARADDLPERLDLLASVVVRCSQTNGHPRVTEALSGKAAGAAVRVLGHLRDAPGPTSPLADEVLRRLQQQVTRGDILRRISKALDQAPG
jgi:hypothetical protein